MSLNESMVEDAALEWFGELEYAVGHGPHLAPVEQAAERESFGEVVLVGACARPSGGCLGHSRGGAGNPCKFCNSSNEEEAEAMSDEPLPKSGRWGLRF